MSAWHAFCPECISTDPKKQDALKKGAWVYELRVSNGNLFCSKCRALLGKAEGSGKVKLELMEVTKEVVNK